ncbi:MAG: 2-C-methyl-D-erythritol 2,4-cyclodiphosphate synthase [Deferribacterales bacterium]
MKIKTGIGFDAHRFKRGRRLIIGGVEIDYDLGLDGHSDADVLIHAIVDAIAGPSLGKDIGNIFPDTDDSYKDIDSKILLKKAAEMIRTAGYEISNIDAEIIAQKPKMAPHIQNMREILAQTLGMDTEDITIKATTTEKMGFTGRGEGIAAVASALVIRN